MLVLNFGHPLTVAQCTQIEKLVQRSVERVVEIGVQIVEDVPLSPQVTKIADLVDLDSRQWQTLAFLVNLPNYSAVAACLLAEIEGRSGHLPAIIKTRRISSQLLTEYEIAEIVNLQVLRTTARTRRKSNLI